MKRITGILFFVVGALLSMQAQVGLTINPAERSSAIGDRHYGIFFEEINHSGDGGLYAELIRNRSFEDNISAPDYWTANSDVNMTLTTTDLLNSAQGNALSVSFFAAGGTITNSGFWGINIVQGTTYSLTFYAKSSDYNGNLTASLMDGTTSVGSSDIAINNDGQWHKYTTTITATATAPTGTFQLQSQGTGTVVLDVVSLFPPTYKDRPNGCRRDLAQKLEDMHPKFMRFPGGCYIEGELEADRFHWKNTIGAIEERPGHLNNVWHYQITDGFGFHEMLQLAEDIGAEPLYVVNIGLGHQWYAEFTDLQSYIDDALDALEYANGDASTKYGAMRVANGHPEPFNIKMVEIGNENYNYYFDSNYDRSYQYAERYYEFYKAIKAKYPDMMCIGNVQAWGTDNPSWRNTYPVDAVDEHYYRSPSWFVNTYNKYDYYNRETSPKVYAGEYAVTSECGTYGNLAAALGEAVYMEGMENNSDICVMSSYAPIFINENDQCWKPDMIRYNCHESYVTPSYYVQNLMANNVGKENVKWTEQNNTHVSDNHVALGTWSTAASFKNYKITLADGTVIIPDFTLKNGWKTTGGNWKLAGDSLTQTNTNVQGKLRYENVYDLGDTYTIELDAKKISGTEGFLIVFNYRDADNYCWWNLGGWGNTQHVLEYCSGGSRNAIANVYKSLVTGQAYHLKIVVAGAKVQCYMDGELIHECTIPYSDSRKVYVASNINDETGKLYVKLVNPGSEFHNTNITLTGYHTEGGKLIQMTSLSDQNENTTVNQNCVVPTESDYNVSGSRFTINIPAYSFNILELDVKTGELADEGLLIETDMYYLYNKKTNTFLNHTNGGNLKICTQPIGVGVDIQKVSGGYTMQELSDKTIWLFQQNDSSELILQDKESGKYLAIDSDGMACYTNDANKAFAVILLSEAEYANVIAVLNDYTSYISNPSFEKGSLSMWTNTGTKVQSNTEPNAKKSGTYYCEAWVAAPSALEDICVKQTIINLPAGKYRLTATCHGENQTTHASQAGVYLFAGEAEVSVSDAQDYSVDFNVTTGQSVVIGFKTCGTNCNWVTVDNFRLTFLSSPTGVRYVNADITKSNKTGRTEYYTIDGQRMTSIPANTPVIIMDGSSRTMKVIRK